MMIQRINLNDCPETVLKQAAKLIEAGGIVALPTDTSYGLATNPLRTEAVLRLHKMKQRDEEQAMACVFRDLEHIIDYAHVDKRQRRIIERNLPGPFTFILNRKVNVHLPWTTVGVRIPSCRLTKMIADKANCPYTITSANIHGQPAAYTATEIIAQFEGKIYQPDLILDGGELPPNPVSAVIDIRGPEPVVIREGALRLSR